MNRRVQPVIFPLFLAVLFVCTATSLAQVPEPGRVIIQEGLVSMLDISP